MNKVEPKEKGVKRNKDETRHMNITFAWQLGYTGKDVVVSILDDGYGGLFLFCPIFEPFKLDLF